MRLHQLDSQVEDGLTACASLSLNESGFLWFCNVFLFCDDPASLGDWFTSKVAVQYMSLWQWSLSAWVLWNSGSGICSPAPELSKSYTSLALIIWISHSLFVWISYVSVYNLSMYICVLFLFFRQRIPSKNVYYYRCPDHRKNYVMSFAFCFDREDDIYQFAYCYPYTYTRLQHYLDNLQRRNMNYFCRELLGLSVVSSNHACQLVGFTVNVYP